MTASLKISIGLLVTHVFDRVAAGVADERYQARQHGSSDDTEGDRADDRPVNRPKVEGRRQIFRRHGDAQRRGYLTSQQIVGNIYDN